MRKFRDTIYEQISAMRSRTISGWSSEREWRFFDRVLATRLTQRIFGALFEGPGVMGGLA